MWILDMWMWILDVPRGTIGIGTNRNVLIIKQMGVRCVGFARTDQIGRLDNEEPLAERGGEGKRRKGRGRLSRVAARNGWGPRSWDPRDRPDGISTKNICVRTGTPNPQQKRVVRVMNSTTNAD
jgi:hypothetical protein